MNPLLPTADNPSPGTIHVDSPPGLTRAHRNLTNRERVRREIPLISLAFLAASASGCGLRTLAVRSTAGLIEAGAPSFHREADLDLAREALPSQLKLLESLLESDPANPALLKSLSEGFTAYAFLFVEEERPERARELYRRALDYSLRLAGLDPALASLRTMTPDALDAALSRTTRRSVPGLYWSAYAWSAWANLAKDDPEALFGLPKAARLMKRVLDLDPGFQFGGADLWFGVYYSARPQIAGGELSKSRAHFEASLGRSGGDFLLAKTLFAKWYAVAALDEELFRRLHEEVLAAPPDALPQARLANEAAKRQSKKLLEKIHELF